jgi:hypothetical protein
MAVEVGGAETDLRLWRAFAVGETKYLHLQPPLYTCLPLKTASHCWGQS